MENNASLSAAVNEHGYDLSLTRDCIGQIVYGHKVVQKGWGIADEALVAYLKIDGNSVKTLYFDLQEAGCDIAKQTLANRQSKLRKQGLLPESGTNAGRPAKAITEPVIDVDPEVVEVINDSLEELYKAELQKTKDLRAELTHESARANTLQGQVARLEGLITDPQGKELPVPLAYLDGLNLLLPTEIDRLMFSSASDDVKTQIIALANDMKDQPLGISDLEELRQQVREWTFEGRSDDPWAKCQRLESQRTQLLDRLEKAEAEIERLKRRSFPAAKEAKGKVSSGSLKVPNGRPYPSTEELINSAK